MDLFQGALGGGGNLGRAGSAGVAVAGRATEQREVLNEHQVLAQTIVQLRGDTPPFHFLGFEQPLGKKLMGGPALFLCTDPAPAKS